jgi:hypothetical protein
MLADLGRMDTLLVSAASASGNGQPGQAVAAADQALAVAQGIRRRRNTVLREITATEAVRMKVLFLPRIRR